MKSGYLVLLLRMYLPTVAENLRRRHSFYRKRAAKQAGSGIQTSANIDPCSVTRNLNWKIRLVVQVIKFSGGPHCWNEVDEASKLPYLHLTNLAMGQTGPLA